MCNVLCNMLILCRLKDASRSGQAGRTQSSICEQLPPGPVGVSSGQVETGAVVEREGCS